MSNPSAPEQVVRRWFNEVWNQRNKSVMSQMLAPHAKPRGLPQVDIEHRSGPAAFEPLFDTLTSAFSDLHFDVEQCVAQGDWVVVRCSVSGRHTGPGLSLPATGRSVRFGGMSMARVVDGRIQESHNCYDFDGLYRQLDTQRSALL